MAEGTATPTVARHATVRTVQYSTVQYRLYLWGNL
jgi:hypothetical protein